MIKFNLQAVQDALRERDEQNGQVSGAKLEEVIKSFQTNILNGVDERINTLRQGLSFNAADEEYPSGAVFHTSRETEEVNVSRYVHGKYPAFVYAVDGEEDRKFWQVPSGFIFPRVNRYEGWKFWLLGMPDHQQQQADGTVKTHPIMPFRYFDDKLFPKTARNTLCVNW